MHLDLVRVTVEFRTHACHDFKEFFFRPKLRFLTHSDVFSVHLRYRLNCFNCLNFALEVRFGLVKFFTEQVELAQIA
jgi:hypothetical protein